VFVEGVVEHDDVGAGVADGLCEAVDTAERGDAVDPGLAGE
jgi:hypothetical protein